MSEPAKTRAQRAKFHLELMLVLIISGRTEEAAKAAESCMGLLDELIKEGQ